MTASHRVHERCGCGAARGPFSLAGTERQYERSRPYRIEHLFVDLALDFETKSVRGRVVLDFSASRRSRAACSSTPSLRARERARRRRRGAQAGQLQLRRRGHRARGLPERGQLRIDYKATPKRGLYFLAPDEQVKHRPVQAWTQCQDEDARHFIPCVDKPHVK